MKGEDFSESDSEVRLRTSKIVDDGNKWEEKIKNMEVKFMRKLTRECEINLEL